MLSDLLPGNATAWERALADALDTTSSLSPAITAIRGTKLLAPPPSFLPFLIYEYGLGELTPYVPNLYELIAEGVAWQRLRGTPAAVALALRWLDHSGDLEEEGSLRRYWNLFQLRLDRVRDNDADLEQIEGVTRLSAPARSVFWRGYHGLDIRPLTFSQGQYGETHFGEYSGKRLRLRGPLWSFGRVHEFDLTANNAVLAAFGVYNEPLAEPTETFGLEAYWFEHPLASIAQTPFDPVDLSVDTFSASGRAFEQPFYVADGVAHTDADLGWGWELPEPVSVATSVTSLDLTWGDFTWAGTEASWESNAQRARSEGMASGVAWRRLWFAFIDQDGAVIGYRRARALRIVASGMDGQYQVNGISYRAKASPDVTLYAECQTDFGDGVGRIASQVGLVLDAQPVNPATPGRMWLEPSEITGGTDIAALTPIHIAFGETIRERVKFLLRF